MEEFRNMRDHYQQANNVILSQAPIAPLTYEDEPEERVAAHESRKYSLKKDTGNRSININFLFDNNS